MHPTPIGIVLIIVGFILFLFRPHWLYILTIFFVPFSDTAVLNFGSGTGTFALQATMFLGALWMARQALGVIYTGRLQLASGQRAIVYSLIIFCIITLASLAMPFVINGAISVPVSSQLVEMSVAPLTFGSRHVSQWIYLAYGVLLAIFIAAKNSKPENFTTTLRVSVWSSIVVSCWGMMQFIFFPLGIPYPDFIFNTSKSQAAGGFSQVIGGGYLTRISSAAVEPSVLGQCMLLVLPVIFFAFVSRRYIVSKKVDAFAMLVVALCLLLSTSSTAYLGLFFALVITLCLLARLGRFQLRQLVWAFAVPVVATVSCFTIPAARTILQVAILEKPQSWSAFERLINVLMAWKCFLRYPLLGIGWGTLAPSNLIIYLLGHTGILGFSVFTVMIVLAFRHLNGRVQRTDPEAGGRSMWYAGILTSFLVLLFVCIITGFTFYFSHFWLLLGLVMAVPSAVISKGAVVPNEVTAQATAAEGETS